jgi:tetratricopeptide (TPR) repeat protein
MGETPADRARALLVEVQRHLAAGRLDAAEAAARQAATAAPGVAECHNALGVALRVAERFDEAAGAYAAALAIDPANARAHNNLGDVHRLRGDHAAAVAAIRQALALDPGHVEAWRNLALCHHALEEHEAAAEALRRALALAPGQVQLHYALGKVEHDRGAHAAAVAAYRVFLASVPDHVEALVDLGMALVELGADGEAIAAFERALALRPGDAAAEFGLRETIARLTPPWHIPMMNEPQRNLAYREAIRAVVGPDDHVLEIGTGAGLLALLSAEAGARRVTTCEMVDVVAAEARSIVARSRYADRVAVVGKRSTALQVGVDLPEKADVLVSEILADDFVGEGVLTSLVDARRRLLKPGARMVPARGDFMGVLVGGAYLEYLLELGEVCGFDMASFARLRPWRQAVPQRIDYDALSDDLALIGYDFADLDSMQPIDRTVPVTVTRAGRCYGVLQWIRLELAPGVTYENHPRSTESVWNKVLYAFPEPRDVRPGDVVDVRLWQRGDYLYLTGA